MSDYYDPTKRDPSLSRRPMNRRGDGWIKELLARVQVCRVATAWDEFPFINPTTFVYRPETHDIIFHSNIAGRLRANTEHSDRATIEVSEVGRLLPSNDPLELGMQYRSVIVFGRTQLLEDEEARQALYQLMARYFPELRPGVEARPIPDGHLARTSVYALRVERWSGKENWIERADQTEDWPPLPAELLEAPR